MRKMNRPITSETARPITVSRTENSDTFSRKLDLKISLKLM